MFSIKCTKQMQQTPKPNLKPNQHNGIKTRKIWCRNANIQRKSVPEYSLPTKKFFFIPEPKPGHKTCRSNGSTRWQKSPNVSLHFWFVLQYRQKISLIKFALDFFFTFIFLVCICKGCWFLPCCLRSVQRDHWIVRFSVKETKNPERNQQQYDTIDYFMKQLGNWGSH